MPAITPMKIVYGVFFNGVTNIPFNQQKFVSNTWEEVLDDNQDFIVVFMHPGDTFNQTMVTVSASNTYNDVIRMANQ
jgi:hypothetical protein